MAELDQPRVLLVDDNEEILDRAAAVLMPSCVVVGTATNGAAAIDSARALRPDVIVLDISMPGMSGLEVAGRLRRAGSTVPIVFLTIYDDDEIVSLAEALGGVGYVAKTMLPCSLATAVSEACAGRRCVSRAV